MTPAERGAPWGAEGGWSEERADSVSGSGARVPPVLKHLGAGSRGAEAGAVGQPGERSWGMRVAARPPFCQRTPLPWRPAVASFGRLLAVPLRFGAGAREAIG